MSNPNSNNGGSVFGYLILVILICWLISSVSSCGPKSSRYDDDRFWSRQETWDSFAEWNAKQ